MSPYSVSSSSRHLTTFSFAGTSRRRRPQRMSRHGFQGLRDQRGAGWGFFLTGVGVILLLVAAGFLYIHQVTSSAVGGYDITSLERHVNALKEQEQQLELKAAELQSLKAIEERIRRLNFIPTEQMAFTSPLFGGSVAFSGDRGEF